MAQTTKKAPAKPATKPTVVRYNTNPVVISNTAPSNRMTDIDSVSYAIGVNIGQSFKNQGLDNINVEMVKSGIADYLKSAPLKVSEGEVMNVIQSYMMKLQAEKGKVQLEAGQKFLAENKTKPGVKTTASGLQYEVIKEGSGEKPTTSDRVKVHYTGKLISGQVFDSSVERGTPATFKVTEVIAGWTEALQLMNPGTKLRVYLPYNIAYGTHGSPPSIPPYSTLIFDVELLEIVK